MLADTHSFTEFWSQQEGPAPGRAAAHSESQTGVSMVVRSAAMETVMAEQVAFSRAARDIVQALRSKRRLSKQDVGRFFFESGFMGMLGCGDRHELMDSCLSGDQLHVCLRSFTGRPIALIEFQQPGDDLGQYTVQLELDARRVLGRSLGLAASTNGYELWIFRMKEGRMWVPATKFNLAALTPSEIRAMLNYFQHCQVPWPRQLRSPQLW